MNDVSNKKIVPELLAPAGNMECLRTAAYFGADAVYVAGKAYGLRAFADNFNYNQLADSAEFLHKMGKKLYVTVNVLMRNADLPGLPKHLSKLKEAGADESVLTLKSLEALKDMADGKATKIIVPSDLQGLAGLATSLKEIMTDKNIEKK